MASTDKRKQSLYFPEEMLKEMAEEAIRQDRSLSWVMQRAWKIARERVTKIPGVRDLQESGKGSPPPGGAAGA